MAVRAHRYELDTIHPFAKSLFLNIDIVLYGLEPLCLLLWWGDLDGMRAGVSKVLDSNKRILARVNQGEASAEGCASLDPHLPPLHARAACIT